MSGRPSSDDAARALQSLLAAASQQPSSSSAAAAAAVVAAMSSSLPSPNIATDMLDPSLSGPLRRSGKNSSSNNNNLTASFATSLHPHPPPSSRPSSSIYTPLPTRSGRQPQPNAAADREVVMFNDYFDFPSSDEEDDLDFLPRSEQEFDFGWGDMDLAAEGIDSVTGTPVLEDENGYDTFGAPSVDEDEEEDEEEEDEDDEEEDGANIDEPEALPTPTFSYDDPFAHLVAPASSSIINSSFRIDPIASTSAFVHPPLPASYLLQPTKLLPGKKRLLSPTKEKSRLVDAAAAAKRARKGTVSSSSSSDHAFAIVAPDAKDISEEEEDDGEDDEEDEVEDDEEDNEDDKRAKAPTKTKRAKYTKAEAADRRKMRNAKRMALKRATADRREKGDAARIEILERDNERLRTLVEELKSRLVDTSDAPTAMDVQLKKGVKGHTNVMIARKTGKRSMEDAGSGSALGLLIQDQPSSMPSPKAWGEISSPIASMSPEYLLAFDKLLERTSK